ncbi:hypothetical protein BK127_27560 [Paenibacillus sp. FSL H7-0331]|nr:hypothetical protein BK127_27560 [Paenibacillus sp. FSL H7-0331]
MIQLLFWPLMICSVITSLLGVIFSRSSLLFISACLILPLSLYLSATPRFSIWGLVFPLLYMGSALSINKRARLLSVILLFPVYFLIAWLGYVVINQ